MRVLNVNLTQNVYFKSSKTPAILSLRNSPKATTMSVAIQNLPVRRNEPGWKLQFSIKIEMGLQTVRF